MKNNDTRQTSPAASGAGQPGFLSAGLRILLLAVAFFSFAAAPSFAAPGS